MTNTNKKLAPVENTNKFYFAVDDSTAFFGKKNEMKRIFVNYDKDVRANDYDAANFKQQPYDWRSVSKKFVDSPLKAALNVVCTDSKVTNDPEFQKDFFSNLKYDDKSGTYHWWEYLTDKALLPPKKHHMDMFNAGEYRLVGILHEITVLSTNHETIPQAELDNKRRELFKK